MQLLGEKEIDVHRAEFYSRVHREEERLDRQLPRSWLLLIAGLQLEGSAYSGQAHGRFFKLRRERGRGIITDKSRCHKAS